MGLGDVARSLCEISLRLFSCHTALGEAVDVLQHRPRAETLGCSRLNMIPSTQLDIAGPAKFGRPVLACLSRADAVFGCLVFRFAAMARTFSRAFVCDKFGGIVLQHEPTSLLHPQRYPRAVL